MQSMYQIAFPAELLASLVPWLMLNRDGLTVFLHPETGDDYRNPTPLGSALCCHCGWRLSAKNLGRTELIAAQSLAEPNGIELTFFF